MYSFFTVSIVIRSWTHRTILEYPASSKSIKSSAAKIYLCIAFLQFLLWIDLERTELFWNKAGSIRTILLLDTLELIEECFNLFPISCTKYFADYGLIFITYSWFVDQKLKRQVLVFSLDYISYIFEKPLLSNLREKNCNAKN